jgi:HD-GYP domain-containing protein (c-di-GMP phosphodiesterase class II)
VQTVLRNIFLITSIGTLLATVVLTILASRSIVRPISQVIARLRETEKTGLLPEFHPDPKLAPVQEIRELQDSFNEAARAIRDAREGLHQAYIECVGALASALDARDRYTAGHSSRVSEFSCAIARAMNLSPEELDDIRIGALLHDIGKIGIPDSVLQKGGILSNEEFALIQQHPTIGRTILEGVGGLQPYLATVELHHENWNGTGYPKGQRGTATPLPARIVHVADAYDAMTSDRPYRRAMSKADALTILKRNGGIQFDPEIVTIFATLLEGENETAVSLDNLSTVVAAEPAANVLAWRSA